MNAKMLYRAGENCYLTVCQFDLLGVTIPKNSFIYVDKNRIAYFVRHVPKYAGNPKNLILHVLCYDLDTRMLSRDIIKGGEIASAIQAAWYDTSKPHAAKPQHMVTMRDYENMMKHDRKKKRGTGGERLINDEQTTDSLRYNQVTEYAYWANVYDSKSGKASVVASSIR